MDGLVTGFVRLVYECLCVYHQCIVELCHSVLSKNLS